MADEISLPDAVQNFAGALAQKVDSFVKDVSELNVRTYTVPTDQMGTVVEGKTDAEAIAMEGKAVLRAYTTIAFDGDTTVWVPVDASGAVDQTVWGLHQGIVQQAMANRAAMLKSVGDAAASALKALKITKE